MDQLHIFGAISSSSILRCYLSKQLIYLSFQLLKDVGLFSLELCGGQGPVGHPPGVYLAWTVGHGRPSGRGQIGAVDIHHAEHFVVDQQGAAQD